MGYLGFRTLILACLYCAILPRPADADDNAPAPGSPAIGCTTVELTEYIRAAKKDGTGPLPPVQRGVIVVHVVAGGPADVCGIQIGDVITRIGDEQVRDGPGFSSAITRLKVGTEYAVSIRRLGGDQRKPKAWASITKRVTPERMGDVKTRAATVCPLTITRAMLGRNVIGIPSIAIQVKNITRQSVVAFTVEAVCTDRFNDPVGSLGIGAKPFRGISQETIEAHDTTIAKWDLHTYERTAKAVVRVMRVKLGDGSEWSRKDATGPEVAVEMQE